MSALRARCPDCRTLTAVSLGPEYECHACGREFAAGLVRVPRAWGEGGEPMAAAAALPLDYPEAALVAEDALAAQTLEVASALPVRPLVLGGCCCAHLGAVEALAARHGRIALVWLDAHGDLNTPASSPTANPWGMPLRMLLDGGTVAADDAVLVGARNLDPPERAFLDASDLHEGASAIGAALAGTVGAYVALDCDVLDPREAAVFMPEPDGLPLAQAVELLRDLAARTTILGAGLTGLRLGNGNLATLERLCRALGLAGSGETRLRG